MKRWVGTLVLIAVGVVLTVPVGGVLALQRGAVSAASTPVAHYYTLGGTYYGAGYGGSANPDGNLSSVSGVWNVVAITCQSGLGVAQYLSTFVSFGSLTGPSAYAVENATCASGSSTPTYHVYAQFPDGTQRVLGSVVPGDLLRGTITTTASAKCSLAVHVKFVLLPGTTGARIRHCAAGFDPTGANWGITDNNGGTDALGGTLAEFSTPVKFTSSKVDYSGTTLAISELYPGTVGATFLLNQKTSNVMAQTTPLSSSGAGFSVVPNAVPYQSAESTSFAGYQGLVSSGSISQVSAVWSNPTLTCLLNLGSRQWINESVALSGGTGGPAYVMESANCPSGSGSPVYTVSLHFPGGLTVSEPASGLAGVPLRATISISATGCGLVVHEKLKGVGTSSPFRASRCAIGFSPNSAQWGVANGYTGLIEFAPAVKFHSCSVVDSGTTLNLSQLSSLEESVVVGGSSLFVEAQPTVPGATGVAFAVSWVSQ